MNSADACVDGQCFCDSGMHALFAVAQESGRVVADEIDVGMSVGVGQVSTLTADEGEREWRVMQDRARSSTGKHGTGTFVLAREAGLRSAVSRRIRSTTPTKALSVVIDQVWPVSPREANAVHLRFTRRTRME